jgi:hypothetical protein
MPDMAAGAPQTVGATIERVLAAYDDLATLGEDVEDEWTYVVDLAAAWRERLGDVARDRADSVVPPAASAAIDRAIDEIGLIHDPHRAIDWLSTYPQVALLALGSEP